MFAFLLPDVHFLFTRTVFGKIKSNRILLSVKTFRTLFFFHFFVWILAKSGYKTMKWTFFCVFLVIYVLLELANVLPENYSVHIMFGFLIHYI